MGADGLHSSVRRLAGLDLPPASTSTAAASGRQRFGLRRHFAVEPWTDLVEVHWADDLEAYVTPVDDDLVGVALLTSRREPFDVQLKEFPALAERLETARAAGDEPGATMGAGPLRQRSRARVSGRVLLVGDAAGYVDALTGEGIAVGLASARAAVAAIAAGTPTAYERLVAGRQPPLPLAHRGAAVESAAPGDRAVDRAGCAAGPAADGDAGQPARPLTCQHFIGL